MKITSYWTQSSVFISNIPNQHSLPSQTSEVVTIWRIDSIVHKLKPRSFHKSTYLQAHLVDFHLWCEPYLTVLSDSQVCYCFWAVLFAKSSVIVLSTKQSSTAKFKMASSCHNSSTATPVPPLGIPVTNLRP